KGRVRGAARWENGEGGVVLKPEPKPETPCISPPHSRAFFLILEFARKRGVKLPLPEGDGDGGKRGDG
ncbi:MAG: hypothetical protein QW356_08830, partial [Candidatus Hadarchaeales archaeon]